MNKKLILVIVITSLALTACIGGENHVEESTADTVLDGQILDSAVERMDLDTCDKVVNSEQREECIQIIESLSKHEEAIEKDDPSLCDNIELERYKENCLLEVENQVTIQELISERDKLTAEAIEKQNISICDNIGDYNFQQECILSVYSDENFLGTDSSVCENIESAIHKDICLNLSIWATN